MSDTVAWNSHEAIVASIEQYKQQYLGAQQEIANLDQERTRLVKVTDNIAGAIGALEQLLENERNEIDAAKKAAEAEPNAG